MTGFAVTVTGEVRADGLGNVLPHEHLMADQSCYWREPQEVSAQVFAEAPVEMEMLGKLRRKPFSNRDNMVLDDVQLACEEITEFKLAGGGTIVDLTIPDVGRDPAALKVISEATDLHIVMGCGHYIQLAHPESVAKTSVEAMAENLIRELTEGVGNTGIRAGVIGEIGTSYPLHPQEEKVLMAAAAAQQATGAAISLHLQPSARNGHEVLDILERAGTNLERVVAGHVGIALAHPDIGLVEAVEYQLSLARRGCYIEYDTCGNDAYYEGVPGPGRGIWFPSDRERSIGISLLMEKGVGKQILVSHDVGLKTALTRYGGHGYSHILRNFVGDLRDRGLNDSEIRNLLSSNPQRMVAWRTN